MPITLSPGAHAAILHHARQAHPHEACGLLLGANAHIHSATLTQNVHPKPQTHFEIDPTALIAAHKAQRTGGPQLLGYWHSHPTGLAEPSATDRAEAPHDGAIWAIVADQTLTVWQDGPNGFEPLSYIVKEG